MKQQWAARPVSTVLLFIPLKHGRGDEGNDDEEAYQAVQKLAAASVQ